MICCVIYINKMTDILFLVGSAVGGAERMTLLYAKILKESGFNCKILVSHCPKGTPIQLKEFLPNEIPWEVIETTRVRYLPIELLKFIRREKAKLVFCSNSQTGSIMLAFKRFHLFSSKVVVRMNTTPTRLSKNERKLGIFAFPKADAIIAQTAEMKAELIDILHLDDSMVTTIYNPLNQSLIKEKIKEVYPFDCSYVNYVAIGGVRPVKGYDTLIEAFGIAHVKQPLTRLYIVGGLAGKTEMQVYESLIDKYSIKDSVFFEGMQPNPYKYTNGCSVYVLSSIKEGLPNAMLEALYLGKPVVATACIPYVKQVINDSNGIVVPVKDPQAMAEALVRASGMKDREKFIPINNTENEIINLFKSLENTK